MSLDEGSEISEGWKPSATLPTMLLPPSRWYQRSVLGKWMCDLHRLKTALFRLTLWGWAVLDDVVWWHTEGQQQTPQHGQEDVFCCGLLADTLTVPIVMTLNLKKSTEPQKHSPPSSLLPCCCGSQSVSLQEYPLHTYTKTHAHKYHWFIVFCFYYRQMTFICFLFVC